MRVGRHASQGGFTMLELLISIVLFSIVGLVSVHAVRLTGRASATTIFRSETSARLDRALERVARELQEARMNTMAPDPFEPMGTSSLTYQTAEVVDGNVLGWGAMRRLELVASATDPVDGIDNDSDGLIDECELRLVRDVGLASEWTTVLVRNVCLMLEGEQMNGLDDNANGLLDEGGFSIVRREELLEVRLSIQALDPERTRVVQTGELVLWPRN